MLWHAPLSLIYTTALKSGSTSDVVMLSNCLMPTFKGLRKGNQRVIIPLLMTKEYGNPWMQISKAGLDDRQVEWAACSPNMNSQDHCLCDMPKT